MWFCQNGYGQIVKWFIQCICDVVQVICQWQIEIDCFFGVWIDNQFFYIYIGCIQEVVFIVDCQYCQCVCLIYCCYVCVFNWIDGDIYCIVVVGIDFFVDIEYWGFVDFVFVNYDGVVNVDLVEYDMYGVDCCVVCGIFIVVFQLFVVSQCCCFGYMGKFDGKFLFYNKFVVKRSGVQCSIGEGGNN